MGLEIIHQEQISLLQTYLIQIAMEAIGTLYVSVKVFLARLLFLNNEVLVSSIASSDNSSPLFIEAPME